MNKTMKYTLVAAFCSMALISCREDIEQTVLPGYICPGKIEFVMPSGTSKLLYIDETGAECLPMIKGETITFGYNLLPSDHTFDDVKWTSSNPSAATVEEGLITAVSGAGTGYSVIQVAPVGMASGSGVYANVKVVVSDELIKANKITLGASADEVYAGESIQMTTKIMPEDATYQTVDWSVSDPSAASIDEKGVLTGKVRSTHEDVNVTVTATALDGSGVTATYTIKVMQIVPPESITLDQAFSVTNGYLCAVGEKYIDIPYTTVPSDCTKSLIEWTSSDESIATVNNGKVTFNQDGNFGDFVITATCPETGNKSEVKMSMPAGLIRELFHNENNYSWYNASQSGNGTSSSHVWHDGYLTVTTYKQNATKQRGDFKCWNPKTFIHAGNYPIIAIRWEDVMDKYEECTARNINLDTSGNFGETKFSGNVGGSNNKWAKKYSCSDGSCVMVYDLSTQSFANGGLAPTNTVGVFGTFQFKYADMATLVDQVTYNVYWIQSFKTIQDLEKYITGEGLTFE